jgi:hypothetical protein
VPSAAAPATKTTHAANAITALTRFRLPTLIPQLPPKTTTPAVSSEVVTRVRRNGKASGETYPAEGCVPAPAACRYFVTYKRETLCFLRLSPKGAKAPVRFSRGLRLAPCTFCAQDSLASATQLR